jgi:hypothetical protein
VVAMYLALRTPGFWVAGSAINMELPRMRVTTAGQRDNALLFMASWLLSPCPSSSVILTLKVRTYSISCITCSCMHPELRYRSEHQNIISDSVCKRSMLDRAQCAPFVSDRPPMHQSTHLRSSLHPALRILQTLKVVHITVCTVGLIT